MNLYEKMTDQSAKEFADFHERIGPNGVILFGADLDRADALILEFAEKHFCGNMDVTTAYIYWLAGKEGF